MSDVTQILSAIEGGDAQVAEQLLPLVYDELRRLAAQKMAHEAPEHTLQATALVHEAYLRLVGSVQGRSWQNRGHFFAAAAEAMRRILVDSARRKQSLKRGRGAVRQELDASNIAAPENSDDLLLLEDALDRLAETDAAAAQLVELRYFAGLTMGEAAQILGISLRTAHNQWGYARSWLRHEIRSD